MATEIDLHFDVWLREKLIFRLCGLFFIGVLARSMEI